MEGQEKECESKEVNGFLLFDDDAGNADDKYKVGHCLSGYKVNVPGGDGALKVRGQREWPLGETNCAG